MSDAVFDAGAWLVRALAGAVFLFLLLPIVAVVPLSFTGGVELVYPLPSASLRWYRDFFNRPEWLLSLRNSVGIGIASTALATALGTAAALSLRRLPPGFAAAVTGLLILPMAIPIVIAAVAFYFFYARLGLASTFTGMVLSHATLALPFVLICVRASLSGLNPDLERAAASLGAPPFRVFGRVVAPLVMPGIATGALFAFAVSFDDVVVAMFVSGPGQITLPRQMFNGVRENISPTILAAATMMIALSACLLAASHALAARSRRLRAAPP